MTNSVAETLGQRIARLRKSKGLTQKGLAEALGISRDLVASYEKDRVRIYDDMILKLAQLFKVSTDQLLGVREIPENTTVAINPKIVKRMQAIQKLSPFQQKSLLLTIDNFLKGAQAPSDKQSSGDSE